MLLQLAHCALYLCPSMCVQESRELLEEFCSLIDHHKEAVDKKFEAFAMEKLRHEYSGGVVSGPNLKQLIIFNQIRKYLGDLTVESGQVKQDFSTLHQLDEGDLKTKFQECIQRFNGQWATHRYAFARASAVPIGCCTVCDHDTAQRLLECTVVSAFLCFFF